VVRVPTALAALDLKLERVSATAISSSAVVAPPDPNVVCEGAEEVAVAVEQGWRRR
jgi:hypothetical protein